MSLLLWHWKSHRNLIVVLGCCSLFCLSHISALSLISRQGRLKFIFLPPGAAENLAALQVASHLRWLIASRTASPLLWDRFIISQSCFIKWQRIQRQQKKLTNTLTQKVMRHLRPTNVFFEATRLLRRHLQSERCVASLDVPRQAVREMSRWPPQDVRGSVYCVSQATGCCK